MESYNPYTFIRNLYSLHTYIRNHKIDIVHCHHRIAALYMGILNLLWNHPYVYTLHIAPVPCDFLHRILTFHGHRTIAISNEVRDFLHEKLRVPSKNIDLVLNGVDESLLKPLSTNEKVIVRQKFGISSGKIVVSIHARISEIKNQISVVHAMNMLSIEERKNLIILCSGEKNGSSYDKIIRIIQKSNLSGNFIFCGWSSAREVIGCSDYMILPSTSEGFGLNCIEAMFLRVPVLRTKTGGYENMKEFCIDLENHTPEIIAKYLRLISNRDPFLLTKINSAEHFVNANCTVTQMTRKTMAVYNSVLE